MILYSHLLIYLLFHKKNYSNISFLIFQQDLFSIFLSKSTLTLYGVSNTRIQIPITPGFAIANYKVLGVTF